VQVSQDDPEYEIAKKATTNAFMTVAAAYDFLIRDYAGDICVSMNPITDAWPDWSIWKEYLSSTFINRGVSGAYV